MAEPIVHHRTPEFKAVMQSCAADLKEIFATTSDVLMLSASGTGAMEAAITNFQSRGDTIIAVNGGKFGQRWGRIARAFGLEVVDLQVEWGRAVRTDEVAAALDAHPNAGGVYLQASETSTGVSHPVEAIAALCRDRDNVICVVDGITAVGVQPLEMDAWGVDVVVSGSQKAFMLPPGLAFIAVSEKAWRKTHSADLPRFYFDLERERKAQAAGSTAYTSAVSLVVGLRKVLDRMAKMGGIKALHAHHERLAMATQAGVLGMGLELLAEVPAWSTTAVWSPEGIGADGIVKGLQGLGIKIAGGQDHLKNRIFRIGHLGWFSEHDIVATIGALETVMGRLGHEPALRGRGVAATLKSLHG